MLLGKLDARCLHVQTHNGDRRRGRAAPGASCAERLRPERGVRGGGVADGDRKRDRAAVFNDQRPGHVLVDRKGMRLARPRDRAGQERREIMLEQVRDRVSALAAGMGMAGALAAIVEPAGRSDQFEELMVALPRVGGGDAGNGGSPGRTPDARRPASPTSSARARPPDRLFRTRKRAGFPPPSRTQPERR